MTDDLPFIASETITYTGNEIKRIQQLMRTWRARFPRPIITRPDKLIFLARDIHQWEAGVNANNGNYDRR
ncbi:MAG: hypothetical protein HQL58_12100 [Magnetococcales bacterium]|nr:hypothetical protein [Magnetococcales bacterium]